MSDSPPPTQPPPDPELIGSLSARTAQQPLEFRRVVKGDKELADDIRREFTSVIEPVLVVCEKAKANGFDLSFNIQCDARGRAVLAVLRVTKEY